jgi:hypothetical protein
MYKYLILLFIAFITIWDVDCYMNELEFDAINNNEMLSSLEKSNEIVASGEFDSTERKSMSKSINITAFIDKTAQLPCFVESGRKFIWIRAKRSEVLSIDSTIITDDKRFDMPKTPECFVKNKRNLYNFISFNNQKLDRNDGIQLKPRRFNELHIINSLPTTISLSANQQKDRIITNRNQHKKEEQEEDEIKLKNGCWRNMLLKDIKIEDEGLYICQIDTMSSFKVYLNILGKFNFFLFLFQV